MAKPIKSLELHYPMIQFFINIYSLLVLTKSVDSNFRAFSLAPVTWNIHIYLKLDYGYHISSIFIGSPDTDYQLIYLHFQIWSMNPSWNKESWIKTFLRHRWQLIKDTLALDLNTNRIHLFVEVSVLEWQRLVLSSWSKSFSRNPGKIFGAVDVQLLVKLFFTCTWFNFRPQTFNSSNQDVLVKLRRIVVVVVVILFRRHTSDKFQEAISSTRTGEFSCIAYLSSMLFLIIFGEVIFQLIEINWECVFILIKFAHGTDVRLVQLCEVFENCSIRLRNVWNNFYDTTDHLQQLRTDQFSSFFARAKPFMFLLG